MFEVTPEETGFPYAAQAALVIRTSHHLKSLKVTQDIQFVLTSRGPQRLSPSQFAQALQGHWTIENRLHYPRDVTLGEDRSTARTGHSPQNLATLRNLVIGLSALSYQQRPAAHQPYLPDFRRHAQYHRDEMIPLVTQPLARALAE